MLTVNDLASGYGLIPIVRGISLDVRDGEALGILGHNGMGKTTLLKTLAGHIRATGGTIKFNGTEIGKSPPSVRARLGIGYVPQGRQIFPALTVLENLRMGAAAAGLPYSIIDSVLEDLPRLRPILRRAGGILSGGEQQILALGRCLCTQPRLVLLDEPTEGIQPSIIDEIVGLLHVLKTRRSLTVVLVEQNLSFVRRLSDRILVIQKGIIKTELKPAQLADARFVDQVLDLGSAGRGQDVLPVAN